MICYNVLHCSQKAAPALVPECYGSWKELYPVCDVVGCFVSQAVAGGLAGDQLEEHHAEAVDVASGADVGFHVGRVDVARRARRPCQHVRGVGAEVGQLGVEVVVQQDVARFHVLVNDRRDALLVQVRQALRRADCDVYSLAP